VKRQISQRRGSKRTHFSSFRWDNFPTDFSLQKRCFYPRGSVLSQKTTFCGILCKSKEKRKAAKSTCYKTAVKCKAAVALCTRVRTTIVFSKLNFKIELLMRTRVQSVASESQNFDFESAFAVLFESTTKPQREAQKRLSEGKNYNITGSFQ